MASDTSSSEFDSLNPREDDEGWEDQEDDREQLRVVSLFDEEVFPDAGSMVAACKQKHGFDFVETQKKLGLDFYESIRLVNYIRSEVRKGNNTPDVSAKELFSSDLYLKPVLEDDALLFSLDELIDETRGHSQMPTDGATVATPSGGDISTEFAQLLEKHQELQKQFDSFRETVDKVLSDRTEEREASVATDGSGTKRLTIDEQQDVNYFDSYSYNDIHATMLKDKVRTDAYRDFIYGNKDLFRGKTVLDVGCGTGILSMFCARAGAAKVIAVDNSDIINKAREIVFTNGLADIITCIRGKIEEVTLPVKEVDIIVSEWMGYCLLFEAMLDSVLWARDRYLKDDGLMVPSHCTLRIAPISDGDYIMDRIRFWVDVYGFDMSAMLEDPGKDAREIYLESFQPHSIAGTSAPFLQLPLHTIKAEELTFDKSFSVTWQKDTDEFNGWLIWFDTFFARDRRSDVLEAATSGEWISQKNPEVTAFTTGPSGPPTHWFSAFLHHHELDAAMPLKPGQIIDGSIEYRKSAKTGSRNLEINLEWNFKGVEGKKKGSWLMH